MTIVEIVVSWKGYVGFLAAIGHCGWS